MFCNCFSDKAGMRINWAERDAGRSSAIPWALEMKAVSAEEPSRLVKTLTGGILGCGGWVLCRGASDSGIVSMLFEFERQACLDIYSVLIAAGIELSQNGHVRLTELCQCTRSLHRNAAPKSPASIWKSRPFQLPSPLAKLLHCARNGRKR